jgi:hypothetical protein
MQSSTHACVHMYVVCTHMRLYEAAGGDFCPPPPLLIYIHYIVQRSIAGIWKAAVLRPSSASYCSELKYRSAVSQCGWPILMNIPTPIHTPSIGLPLLSSMMGDSPTNDLLKGHGRPVPCFGRCLQISHRPDLLATFLALFFLSQYSGPVM